MPTAEPCGTPSPCLLPPPPTRRRPPLRAPPRRCHCTARREHAASRSRVHQDIHPLGGQAGARGKTLRAAAAIDFAEEGGRGGRLTVRRGCSSPERTFRPLDVRVESATRLMSSPPPPVRASERGEARSRTPPPSSSYGPPPTQRSGGGMDGRAGQCRRRPASQTHWRRRRRCGGP